MLTGSELIAQERQRQVEEEGWTVEHDNEHSKCAMALAGASYALNVAAVHSGEAEAWMSIFNDYSGHVWPWDKEWWKPTPDDPVRQLTKAGALIAAEIDRLQRINSGNIDKE